MAIFDLKKLDGKTIRSAKTWFKIRFHEEVMKISYLGIIRGSKAKQEIILKDRTSIIVWF